MDVTVARCKDKGTNQDNQDKETSTERVQREKKRRNSENKIKKSIPVGARFSAPVRTGSFRGGGGLSGQGVALTTHRI
jgi:hypothetical protein